MRFPKPNTLQLQGRIGGTFAKTVLVLIALMVPLEMLARVPQIQALLPPPLLSGAPQVGVKIGILDKAVRDRRVPDCVAVGSSVVDLGIDPEALSTGYQQQTGKPFYCLNGAVTGLEAFGSAKFARIYANRYSVKMVVYGASYRDFGLTFDQFDLNMPWAAYQLGEISPQGWIESNSLSYRYFLTGLWPIVNANTSADVRNAKRYTDLGQRSATRTMSISGNLEPQADPYMARQYGPLDPATMDMTGLNQLIELKKEGIQVVVVEMPLPTTSLVILKDGKKSYDIYLQRLEALTAKEGVPLIRTTGLNLISDDGWSDYSHLNVTGAKEFSKWLGQQLASLKPGL